MKKMKTIKEVKERGQGKSRVLKKIGEVVEKDLIKNVTFK